MDPEVHQALVRTERERWQTDNIVDNWLLLQPFWRCLDD